MARAMARAMARLTTQTWAKCCSHQGFSYVTHINLKYFRENIEKEKLCKMLHVCLKINDQRFRRKILNKIAPT